MLGGGKIPKEPRQLYKEVNTPEARAQLKGKLLHIEGATLQHAHRFLVSRWKNLQEVRRHALGWALFIIALSAAVVWQSSQTLKLYSQELPSEGTVYSEGVSGKVDNLNPIFASTQAERAASRLLFANLFTYNDRGDLVGELASRWSSDQDGKTYLIAIRNDARWHDGEPITADDVVYTFSVIKDADTRSPLYSSWRNVAVEKIDAVTVKFTLPTAYSPFLDGLRIGILPKHILGDLQPAQLRNNNFNSMPTVGSGPFAFQDTRALDTDRTRFIIRLAANKNYFMGAPKLNRFNLQAFADQEQLLNAFRSQEVAAVADLRTNELEALGLRQDMVRTESPLFNAVYAFLRVDSPLLSDVKVRLALQDATNRTRLITKLGSRFEPVVGPLLPGQLGYQSDLRQPDAQVAEAERLLDTAGWKLDKDGKRTKDGQPLKIQLATVSGGDYPAVASELADQWSKLGVVVESQLIRAEDIQQNIIAPRAYDVLVYEIALGRDPDVFAYWHSSQANERGFNLSNYKAARVDDALDGARATPVSALRTAKYRGFITQWLDDVPAIGLYRPSLNYVQTRSLTSFAPRPISEPVDRYYNVLYWSAGKELLNPTL